MYRDGYPYTRRTSWMQRQVEGGRLGLWLVGILAVLALVMALLPHKPLNCKKWSSDSARKLWVCVEFGEGKP